MDINLYYPNHDSDIITFTITNTFNSITVFVFSFTNGDNQINLNMPTKLVSGYEKNYRQIDTKLSVLDENHTDKVDGYIISCIRLPYIATKLISLPNFSEPLSTVITQIKNETQIWHILSVRKYREQKMCKKILGVYINENGRDVFYKKETILAQGNVPSGFISTLTKHTNNVHDLDMGIFVYPHVKRSNENVSLIFK
ncbi:ac146 [Erannis ankeraria nucleopolyhedrovirus]|uniref:ac146 n=1 Tax=Erannis ankeraria nucleopolyhedrovirus TaxID=2913600 RepID=UPI00117BA6AA|nr:ac146 [Erannis ankeraria nucleopolyhedrovirus]UJZ88957.1 ac146 [Erannis ankeraria nucleopolyhedrovirus]